MADKDRRNRRDDSGGERRDGYDKQNTSFNNGKRDREDRFEKRGSVDKGDKSK